MTSMLTGEEKFKIVKMSREFIKNIDHSSFKHSNEFRDILEDYWLDEMEKRLEGKVMEVREEIVNMQKRQIHEPDSITWMVRYYDVLDLPNLQINKKQP